MVMRDKDGRWIIPSHHDYPADVKDRLRDTAVGGVTLGEVGPLADLTTAVLLNGSTGKVTVASTALNLTAGPLSVEAWAKKPTSSSMTPQ